MKRKLVAIAGEYSYDGRATWGSFPEVFLESRKGHSDAYPKSLPYPDDVRTRGFYDDGSDEVISISREGGKWLSASKAKSNA